MRIEATTESKAQTAVEIDVYPDACPLCHYGIEARYQHLAFVTEGLDGRLELIFQCPRRKCLALFISRYFHIPGSSVISSAYFYRGSLPFESFTQKFSEHISKISPLFCEIFNQSQNAEQRGWKLVAGPGYRKALEFLVKDYLCRLQSAQADKIKGLQLGSCIEEFVDNDKVKQMAKRAAWLGNDETHYVRKWEDKDLEDLKKLIELTVLWIEMEEMTSSVLKDMPEGKK